jgi:hypothetical protein
MRFTALQKLVILLTGLVFLVGTGAQAMAMPSARLMALSRTSAEYTVMREGCATMTMLGNAELTPTKQAPCKRISFDCASQLGCICSPALPAPPTALASPVAWELLAYWTDLTTAPVGQSIKPNLHPPMAA